MISLIFFTLILVLRILIIYYKILIEYMSILCYIINKTYLNYTLPYLFEESSNGPLIIVAFTFLTPTPVVILVINNY